MQAEFCLIIIENCHNSLDAEENPQALPDTHIIQLAVEHTNDYFANLPLPVKLKLQEASNNYILNIYQQIERSKATTPEEITRSVNIKEVVRIWFTTKLRQYFDQIKALSK